MAQSAVSGSAVLQGTSIFLLGMMGSGKTTTGRMLGNVLKYCFFDSDAVIEQAVGGATVADIFRENGEDSFRDMEKAVLQELCTYKNCIVATGGGVVVRCAPLRPLWPGLHCDEQPVHAAQCARTQPLGDNAALTMRDPDLTSA